MKETEAMKSRLYTSHSNVLPTDLILPVTQEHKLYLEGIEDNHGFLDDKVEKYDSLNTSNQY
jgi:hypothetical protein